MQFMGARLHITTKASPQHATDNHGTVHNVHILMQENDYDISDEDLKYFWKPKTFTNYFVTLTWLIS
jgi:hypothetical protein